MTKPESRFEPVSHLTQKEPAQRERLVLMILPFLPDSSRRDVPEIGFPVDPFHQPGEHPARTDLVEPLDPGSE